MMTWLMVALGGALGALGRYGLSVWLAPQPGKFPSATFCANVLGCFVMGVLYMLMVNRALLPISWRPFLTVGLLGAFTTFSTFSLEAFWLWQHQQVSLAILYVVATLVACLLAVWAGHYLCGLLIPQ
jgi:CrcB protein